MQSAARSRLASIYSGQTGFDIYTRATSDVYQDLNGEGIFTGKGIYEVEILSQVLEHRFPRNALLSHDLIEGAYARAGLVSDVEVIDDYPSHYSAYNRRKHRWLRGDWQIVSWLFGRVPDENGRRVPNPISFLSRWKILDNLRRSLVEAGMFLLLVLGWTVLPGRPVYWTLVTIAILFVPPWFQFAILDHAGTDVAPIGADSRRLHRAGCGHFERVPDAHVSGASNLAIRRCGIADFLSPHGVAPTFAAMGDRRRGRDGNRQAHFRGCPAELDARRGLDRRRDGVFLSSSCVRSGAAGAGSLGLQQAGIAVVESSTQAGAEGCDSARQALLAARCVVHLALFCDILQSGTQLADSRQCSGGAAQDRRPHIADEPGLAVQRPAGCV